MYGTRKSIDYIPLDIRSFIKFIEDDGSKLGWSSLKSSYLKKNSIYAVINETEVVKSLNNKSYNYFIKERDYYYDYPEYIYNNYSDIEEISNDSFIRIHIRDILNKAEVRKKLIVYFANKFVSYYILSNTKLCVKLLYINLGESSTESKLGPPNSIIERFDAAIP